MVMDIKRAFLHAPILREVYINLPEEAQGGDRAPMMGLLHVHCMARETLHKAGSTIYQVCWPLWASNRDVLTHVCFAILLESCLFQHVDDFMCLGASADLSWLKLELGKRFEFTSAILGTGAGESQEVQYLNRTLKWTSQGISYEHDSKHVSTVLKELGLVDGKGVSTPGVKEGENSRDKGGDQLLAGRDEQMARRLIAVLNYLSQDRLDVGYAVKEAARQMSKPTKNTLKIVQRIARYLQTHPLRPQLFRWQCDPKELCTYTDADWAGCERTRRSTSGGVVLRGQHVIKAWSRTQSGIALSSGEAELVAVVKGSTETLGLKRLAEEMDEATGVKILTDSSAAKGAVTRSGSGRMKHLATNNLWVQEKARSGEIVFVKIPRGGNYADMLTHHWDSSSGEKFLTSLGMSHCSFV